MSRNHIVPRIFQIFTLLLALTLLAGCGNAPASSTVPEPTSAAAQQLQFFVEEAEPTQAYAPYCPSSYHKGYQEYAVVNDEGCQSFVSIGGGNRLELTQAIETGAVTPEAILAQLEADARRDVCQMQVVHTHYGLSRFVYDYGDFQVSVVDSLYLSEREGQFLYRCILFTNREQDFRNIKLLQRDDEGYFSVANLDWGLTVKADSVTPSGMQLHITQNGRETGGELFLSTFWTAYRKTSAGWEAVTPTKAYQYPSQEEAMEANRTIRPDGQTTFPVDWTAQLGTLEPGSYNFRFFVYRHRPGELAELYDQQTLKVQIAIPEE